MPYLADVADGLGQMRVAIALAANPHHLHGDRPNGP